MEMVQADRIPTAETLGHNENRMPPKTKEPNLLAQWPSAHLPWLVTRAGLGTISRSSDVVRFV